MTRPWWRQHWPLLGVLAIAAALLFARLGTDYLWADEGDTAVLARNILKFGVPTAWDGVSFTDSDYGARLNDNLVMVSHPWLQYYLAAAAFAVLGESAMAARVPFALSGLATVALAYLIVFRVTRHRWTACSAAALVTMSAQFLLYSRQGRNYSLNAALTCALVYQFSRLDSWRNSLIFAGIGVLLFHSHPIAVAPLLALGLMTLVYPASPAQRRWFWRAMPVVAVFTLPWLVVARAGYAQNTGLAPDFGALLSRMAQFAVECASVTPMAGVIVLGAVAWFRREPRGAGPKGKSGVSPRRAAVFAPPEWMLVVSLATITAAYVVAMGLTQPPDEIFALGVRYTPAVIPFVAMVAAMLVAGVSRGRPQVWAALLLALGLTKAGGLTPWTFWQAPRAKPDPAAVVTFHNPPRGVDRAFATDLSGVVLSIGRDNRGTTARIVEFLSSHASPQDVVVTNYGWEPLYFHTRLPLGMTVLSSYPIYGAAKARGLPDYVFRAQGARWIVWRQAWGAYRGQALDRVLAELETAGVPATLVASIPETLWENRENIHFRRFPGDRYIYPWYGELPDALVYRVDWPAQLPSAGSTSPDPAVFRTP